MSATLARIFRHPIKSHGREELGFVDLAEGESLPWDRHWAVAHEAAKLPQPMAWAPCVNFSRCAKAPLLTAIEAKLDEGTGRLTLGHPDLPDITFDPERDSAAFLAWAGPLIPDNRAASAALVRAPGRAMTDTDFPSVSIMNTASNAALADHMGQPLDPRRWRANLWLEGLEAWAETGWLGRDLKIGEAILHVEQQITRCAATTANPVTGQVEADTLGALPRIGQGREFGLYARVTRGGRIAAGDRAELL